MNTELIENILVDYTCMHSNYETYRDYVSLSHCALSVDEIVNQYWNGFKDTKEIRLRCYKGYQMEFDLLQRLSGAFPGRISGFNEISAYNGLVKGHPDFSFDDYPGDCKSVLKDEWIPEPGKLPRKVYWQMQGYMLYSKKSIALVIYESRESGYIKVFWIDSNYWIFDKIDKKMRNVVKTIKEFKSKELLT